MAVIPCSSNLALQQQIEEFAEALATQSHQLGAHGLDEAAFYESGILRGAIERLRGRYSADTREKRAFVRLVLNHMQDRGFITSYDDTRSANRHDYLVVMPSGAVCAIALKGCLDGNNTNIFERPAEASEFVLWSICTNPGSDPRHNVWSGIHTRLSAEIIERGQQVDGLVVWDWLCGTARRPCPKLAHAGAPDQRLTEVGQYRLTPPCIYLFPSAIPDAAGEPDPTPHSLESITFLEALHRCFGGCDKELNQVRVAVSHHGAEVVRRTTVTRGGALAHGSEPTPIRRR
ncbi:hypothetical protein GIY56_17700 [Paracoccus sp. YIM 132242]|uniref:Uncharacterized protein n=1 Tax=Paracoccus lichenicola TaxID=2665644 RepID=A0A6L6HSI1_9RHOB|nr:hypothetical protein [Paracoccus lichenicola]MTE02127.1 hypothetical protein [Paracoccus lichenicola]